MRITILLFIVTIAMIFLGCQSSAEKSKKSEPFSVEMVRFQKESANCVDPEQGCARVKLTYPQLHGPDNDVLYRINATIQTEVMNQIGWSVNEEQAATAVDIETIAQNFIDDYEELKKSGAGMTQDWEIDLESEKLYETENLLSIEHKTYVYAGGAHPLTYYVLNTFDLENGQLLSLTDIVKDTTATRKLLDRHFRMARGLDGASSLADEGFFVEEALPFPGEFALTADGLMVIYNSYEVGPYVMGPTEFTIPQAEISSFLKKPYK